MIADASTPTTLDLGNSTNTNLPFTWSGSAYYIGNIFHYNGVTFISGDYNSIKDTVSSTSTSIPVTSNSSNAVSSSNSGSSSGASGASNSDGIALSSGTTSSGSVAASQSIAGNIYPINGVINWKGQRWYLTSGGRSSPGNNYWDNTGNGVWIDSQGRLHLTVRNDNGVWKSTMLNSQYKYKYGTFTWKVDSPVYTYDKNSVVGLFTYLDDNNELDIETSRWGNPTNGNLWYTVQPYGVAGNEQGYNVPSYIDGSSTYYRIDWQPTSIRFVSWKSDGTLSDGTLIADHTYTNTAGIPATSQYVMMNFWMMSGTTPQQDMELIISDFSVSNTGEVTNSVPT